MISDADRNNAYLLRRSQFRNKIFDTVNAQPHIFEIRGSWKFGDFHLDILNDHTESDIDLLAESNLANKKPELIRGLYGHLSQILKMKISIHFEDHLSQIEYTDSKIKNIFEYLITVKNSGSKNRTNDYMKAKIMLLLLKKKQTDQRYSDIKNELAHPCVDNLFEIKIGYCNRLDMSALSNYMELNADPTTLSFFHNCIKTEPDESYFKSIRSTFLDCSSISPWLKEYIDGKLI